MKGEVDKRRAGRVKGIERKGSKKNVTVEGRRRERGGCTSWCRRADDGKKGGGGEAEV